MIHLALICIFAPFFALTLLALRHPRGTAALTVGLHLATGLLLLFSALMTGVLYDHSTYLGDFWVALEAINKVGHGQRSNIDYFNPIGPLYDWIFALALQLRAASATTVPLAGSLLGALAVLGGAVMLHRRISALGLAMALFATAAAAVSGREIDAPFTALTLDYLAPYNRWCWALLIPVTLRLSLPGQGRDLTGALVCGIFLAAMAALKATYAGAAVGLMVFAVGLGVERRAEALLSLVTAALALVIAQGLTGQILPYVEDLRTAALLPSAAFRIHDFTYQSAEMLLFAVIGMMVLALTWQGSGLGRAEAWRVAALLCLVAAMGSVVLTQNHYVTEAAVYCLLPLIAVEWTGYLRRTLPSRDPGIVTIALAVIFITLRPSLVDTAVLATNQLKFLQKGEDSRLAGTMMHDLRIHPRHTGEEGSCKSHNCHDYTRMLDGLALLQAAGAGAPEAGAVFTFNFSNPFPVLLGKPSPRAAAIWYHQYRTFSEEVFAPAETLFADVEFVMVSKTEGNAAAMLRIYGAALEAMFTEVSELGDWRLLRRKPAA